MQSHENSGVTDIVVGQVVDIRCFGEQLLAAGKIDADGERSRLGGAMRCDAGEHFAADLQGGLAVTCRFLNAGKAAADFTDEFETGFGHPDIIALRRGRQAIENIRTRFCSNMQRASAPLMPRSSRARCWDSYTS